MSPFLGNESHPQTLIVTVQWCIKALGLLLEDEGFVTEVSAMAGGSHFVWILLLLSCVFQASDNRHGKLHYSIPIILC